MMSKPVQNLKKVNQTIKFGRLTEFNVRNIFLQKSCIKWGKDTNPRPLALYEVKTSSNRHLSFNSPRLGHIIKKTI